MIGGSNGRKRVFQIAYDEMLLIARSELLRNRGHEICSVLGNDGARRVLVKNENYQIFIVGHAAPAEERKEVAQWLKMKFPDAKILALNPSDNTKLSEADFNFVLNGPEEWLSAVESVAG